jgi:hypothetical protein
MTLVHLAPTIRFFPKCLSNLLSPPFATADKTGEPGDPRTLRESGDRDKPDVAC